MELNAGINPSIPMPEITPLYTFGAAPSRLSFRPFGVIESDLDVDFTTRNRAALATRLLESCTVDSDRTLPSDFYSGLSVGQRIECLLILANGGVAAVLDFPFKCANCEQELEFELTLAEISEIQRDAYNLDTVIVDIDGRGREFRKSSGRDQEAWFEGNYRDENEAVLTMIGDLAIDLETVEGLTADEIDSIDAAMDEAEPLVNLNYQVNCGECGEVNEHNIDLFEAALGMLYRAQRRLITTVHRLASHYHWSEKEIFAVPEWRRREYLELIGRGK